VKIGAALTYRSTSRLFQNHCRAALRTLALQATLGSQQQGATIDWTRLASLQGAQEQLMGCNVIGNEVSSYAIPEATY